MLSCFSNLYLLRIGRKREGMRKAGNEEWKSDTPGKAGGLTYVSRSKRLISFCSVSNRKSCPPSSAPCKELCTDTSKCTPHGICIPISYDSDFVRSLVWLVTCNLSRHTSPPSPGTPGNVKLWESPSKAGGLPLEIKCLNKHRTIGAYRLGYPVSSIISDFSAAHYLSG